MNNDTKNTIKKKKKKNNNNNDLKVPEISNK